MKLRNNSEGVIIELTDVLVGCFKIDFTLRTVIGERLKTIEQRFNLVSEIFVGRTFVKNTVLI